MNTANRTVLQDFHTKPVQPLQTCHEATENTEMKHLQVSLIFSLREKNKIVD